MQASQPNPTGNYKKRSQKIRQRDRTILPHSAIFLAQSRHSSSAFPFDDADSGKKYVGTADTTR